MRHEEIDTPRPSDGIARLDQNAGANPAQQGAVLSTLESYWRSRAAPMTIPDRRAVEPRDLGPSLRHCYTATIIAPGLARIRFAGQDLAQVFGMDVRGMPLSALFDAASRISLHDAMVRFEDRPAIIELPLETRQGFLRRAVPGRMSLLPMRDQAGAVTRIIGAMVFDGNGTDPRPGPISIPTDRAFRIEELQIAAPPPRPEPRPEPGKPRLKLVVDNG